MEELTTVILSGITWDAIKKGVNISANYLKNKLSNWILDDKKLEEISQCVQNIPDTYSISEGMVREYLNLNERLLDILKETKQKDSHISQEVHINNGFSVNYNPGTINAYFGDKSEENLEIEKKN